VPLSNDNTFGSSIAELYERLLVPMLFAPYAEDIARRLPREGVGRVLEIAAGTGAVTRVLARTLPADASLVATDLNPAMLERAKAHALARTVEWRQADVMALPFDDASFDVVVCQFGAMFFPDRPRAFGEVRRVLRDGGVFLFNVWDRLEENEVPDVITRALATMFPANPPTFMRRIPHGYFDRAAVERDLRGGGFGTPRAFDTVTVRSVASSAREAAVAFCQGTPTRNEIEALGPSALDAATDAAERAVADVFGHGAIEGKIQAHVVEVIK
jgi:SAM-dependent methyltransferase